MKNLFYFCVLIFNTTFLLAQETQTESSIDEIIVTAEFNDVGSYSNVTKISSPAGIVLPEKLKPNTVDALVETVKPLAAASPPDAPDTVVPSTEN